MDGELLGVELSLDGDLEGVDGLLADLSPVPERLVALLVETGRIALVEADVDVPVVGVFVETDEPAHRLGGEYGVSQEGRKLAVEEVFGLLPVAKLSLPVLLAQGYDHIPDDGTGVSKLIPRLLLGGVVHQLLGVEHAGEFLRVSGVVHVVLGMGRADSGVDVVQVVLPGCVRCVEAPFLGVPGIEPDSDEDVGRGGQFRPPFPPLRRNLSGTPSNIPLSTCLSLSRSPLA